MPNNAAHSRHLIIDGQTFTEGWGVDLTDDANRPYDYVLVRGCTFIGCKRAVSGWTEGPRVERFIFINNLVVDCSEFGILLANHCGPSVIANNLFVRAGSAAILVGYNPPGPQWSQCLIQNNTIWAQRDKKEVHAILVYGEKHVVRHNFIGYVEATQEGGSAEGIYGKCNDFSVIENELIDAGGYEGQICSKDTECSGTIIYGNTIVHTRQHPTKYNRAVMLNVGAGNCVCDNRLIGPCRIVSSRSSQPIEMHGNEWSSWENPY